MCGMYTVMLIFELASDHFTLWHTSLNQASRSFFSKMDQISIMQTLFLGQKRKKSKAILMMRLMDRVYNSLPIFIPRMKQYFGIWPESIDSVSLHHLHLRTNPRMQSPNLDQCQIWLPSCTHSWAPWLHSCFLLWNQATGGSCHLLLQVMVSVCLSN